MCANVAAQRPWAMRKNASKCNRNDISFICEKNDLGVEDVDLNSFVFTNMSARAAFKINHYNLVKTVYVHLFCMEEILSSVIFKSSC